MRGVCQLVAARIIFQQRPLWLETMQIVAGGQVKRAAQSALSSGYYCNSPGNRMIFFQEQCFMSSKQTQAKNKTNSSKVALFSTIALSFLCSCTKGEDVEKERIPTTSMGLAPSSKSKVVYYIKDMHKDEEIPPDSLEEKEVSRLVIPGHAITSASLASGGKLRFDVSPGQLADFRDLRGRGGIDVILDEKARKKLNDLAGKQSETPSGLVTRWITEKLNNNSK